MDHALQLVGVAGADCFRGLFCLVLGDHVADGFGQEFRPVGDLVGSDVARAGLSGRVLLA
jgi:hypothetical protein